MVRRTTILPCERSPLEMIALNWLAGLAAVVAVSLASARAEEPPRLSLQSTSDFASYGAFYTDLTATYSPFGNLWEPGWRVQGIASARRYSFIDSGTKRIGLDTTLDGLMGYQFISNGWSWLLAAGPSMVNAHVYAAPGLLPSNTTIFGIKAIVFGLRQSDQQHDALCAGALQHRLRVLLCAGQNGHRHRTKPIRRTRGRLLGELDLRPSSRGRAHYGRQVSGHSVRRVVGFCT